MLVKRPWKMPSWWGKRFDRMGIVPVLQCRSGTQVVTCRTDPSFLSDTMRIGLQLQHLLLLPWWLSRVQGFALTRPLSCRAAHPSVTSCTAAAATASIDDLVSALCDQQDDASVLRLIQSLEESYAPNNNSIEPLLGLYNVSRTITARPGENPVGGKWTRSSSRLLTTTATWQHLLAPRRPLQASSNSNSIAQAVNHIRLDALGGMAQIHVLLRGDVTPLSSAESTNTPISLSPRAVQVAFDPPRICLQRNNKFVSISVGPKSSVILDTTYADDRLRIGKGGTSGTRFVFCRSNDNDANEYQALLQQTPVPKTKALRVLSLLALLGANAMTKRSVGLKVLGGLVALTSVACGGLVAFSAGGIEQQHNQPQQLSLEKKAITPAVAQKSVNVTSTDKAVPPKPPTAKHNASGHQNKYIAQSLNDESLKNKYASIDNVEDRAYQILVDLGIASNNNIEP